MQTKLNKQNPFKSSLGILLVSLSLSVIAEDRIVPVTTTPLRDLVIFPIRSAPATAVSLNDTSISAQITGNIMDILVKVGDVVERGELITRLDCADHVLLEKQAEASLQAAKAKNEFARSQMQRADQLSKTKNIAQEILHQRKADVDTSAAEVLRLDVALHAAKRNIEKCDIRAPFKAVVIEKLASVGELAVPGTVIMRLFDQDNIEIRAMVQEQDLPSLKESKTLQFASRDHAYPLTLRSVLPLMKITIRSYEVRLTFSDEKAPPGSAGRLTWKIEMPHLPSDLLVSRDGALGVFIENDGQARFTPIENATQGRPVPVSLPGESAIIIDGRFGLMDGDTIETTGS